MPGSISGGGSLLKRPLPAGRILPGLRLEARVHQDTALNHHKWTISSHLMSRVRVKQGFSLAHWR